MVVVKPRSSWQTTVLLQPSAALRAGLADSVVISYNPSFAQWAWAGPNLADAAVSATQLRGLDAILSRAVCGTDAELFFLPDEADGAGHVPGADDAREVSRLD